MDTLQILERYYQSFIDEDAPKQFFLGMADYLEYAEKLPEFDFITTQISQEAEKAHEIYRAQEKVALKEIKQAHKKIKSYVEKNKIESKSVTNALQQYSDFLEERS